MFIVFPMIVNIIKKCLYIARSFIHNIDDVILFLDSIETKFRSIVITEKWQQNHNAL